MKPKVIKVNCSFCGKEIECPESMMKMEKHACFECFQKLDECPREDIGKIHVDIPMDKMDDMMPNLLMSYVMEEVFPQLWEDEKPELKKMSKKELAEHMFAAGASTMFDALMEIDEEVEEEFVGG